MTERCSVCGGPLVSKYFNFDVGEIVCAACQNAMCEKISDACMGALRILDKTDYDKLESVTLGAMGEIQAYDLLSKDFKYRTGIEVLKI